MCLSIAVLGLQAGRKFPVLSHLHLLLHTAMASVLFAALASILYFMTDTFSDSRVLRTSVVLTTLRHIWDVPACYFNNAFAQVSDL